MGVSGQKEIIAPGRDLYGCQSFQLTQMLVLFTEQIAQQRNVGKMEMLGLLILSPGFQLQSKKLGNIHLPARYFIIHHHVVADSYTVFLIMSELFAGVKPNHVACQAACILAKSAGTEGLR